ncbi:hypothetical protein C0V97_10065 [Asaia sp. W19]|uniref:hypothetical protein n=1 Tax=Asaia sp. HN128 TaxID=3081234 RepID=UPI0010021FA4|nr:hypothetical protein C0V97_10065 [Asaia sp. W19]
MTPASEEDVTFAIRMSISLDYRGKPRRVNAKMTGAEMDALAQKITEQLKRSNMWPHRGPGAPAHQAPDYSVAWRKVDPSPDVSIGGTADKQEDPVQDPEHPHGVSDTIQKIGHRT